MSSLTFPAQVESLPEALELVTTYAAAAGCLPPRLLEIELAVEEALVNICRYAYPQEPGEAEIHCARGEGAAIVIEVRDAGVPFDPTAGALPDLTVDPEQRPVGGLGLLLLRTLIEVVRYERQEGWNILRLTAQLQAAPRGENA